MVINLNKNCLHQPVITFIYKQEPEGSIAIWSFNYNNFILSCGVHEKQTGEDLCSFYAHLFVSWFHARWCAQLAHFVTPIKTCSLRLRFSKWRNGLSVSAHAYSDMWPGFQTEGEKIWFLPSVSLFGCGGKNVLQQKTCGWTDNGFHVIKSCQTVSVLNKQNHTFTLMYKMVSLSLRLQPNGPSQCALWQRQPGLHLERDTNSSVFAGFLCFLGGYDSTLKQSATSSSLCTIHSESKQLIQSSIHISLVQTAF
jgi:hypothetical protein